MHYKVTPYSTHGWGCVRGRFTGGGAEAASEQKQKERKGGGEKGLTFIWPQMEAQRRVLLVAVAATMSHLGCCC